MELTSEAQAVLLAVVVLVVIAVGLKLLGLALKAIVLIVIIGGAVLGYLYATGSIGQP
jgi:hypothetical protein